MKPSQTSYGFKPFKNLKALLENKSVELKRVSEPGTEWTKAAPTDLRPDHTVFKEAMADVVRISRTKCAAHACPTREPPVAPHNPQHEALVKLDNLIKFGTGFEVSLTPEYIEGIARDINPEIARRLHRGDFSIQDHIDLHGLGVADAHRAIDDFFNKNILSGKRAVLIIHGRGLSSPAEPVLKSKVYHWLTTSPWHKWVIAFTSARLCDGGTGATYVLIRRKPLKKPFQKKMKR